jgi:NDP-sugar pyrophosphorylase family protein
MKVGILAAGRGERLQADGVCISKPLVPIRGVPLIGRLLHAVSQVAVGEVVCIVNEESLGVIYYCQGQQWGVPLKLVVKSTAHSLESFLSLRPYLEAEPFLLLTTDTVFSPAVLPAFLQQVSQISDADGVLAVTPFVEDEKPLWVEPDIRGRIRCLGDQTRSGNLVTAGIYFFTPTVYREADTARRLGFGALRQFLVHLVERGYRLYGYTIPKVIDVDRLVDIATAEAFLAEEGLV